MTAKMKPYGQVGPSDEALIEMYRQDVMLALAEIGHKHGLTGNPAAFITAILTNSGHAVIAVSNTCTEVMHRLFKEGMSFESPENPDTPSTTLN
jgi:hypothetical protein